MRKYLTATLLTTIFLAGCQSEPEKPRQVVPGFATAPLEPISINAFDANIRHERQATPARKPHDHPGLDVARTQSLQEERSIPSPWMPQRPEAPFYYWNNFYYQWPFYQNRYFAPYTGPFNTRYNRYGEQIRSSVAPAALKFYQQQPVSPLRRQELTEEQQEQTTIGTLKQYQMQQTAPPETRPDSGLKRYQMR